MGDVDRYLSRLLPVLGANAAIVVLALAGLAVVSRFNDAPLFVLLFVVSLLQGGLMVRAFGPAVGSERGLSLGGQIVGWIGLIGWLLVHFINAGIVALNGISAAAWATAIEVAVYFAVNTLVLTSFYSEPVRERRRRRDAARAAAENHTNHSETDAERMLDQKRREAVRFACQMFYDRHRVELRERFPLKRLRDYFAEYLSEARPAAEVEERGRQLQELLQQLVVPPNKPATAFQSLADLHEHFRVEEQALRGAASTDEQLAAMLADLAYEKARAMRELREP